MEKVIRVLVANRPRLMREVVLETLAGQPGIEVVGEVSDDSVILARVHETLPDLLVIALDDPGNRPQICDAVLREHPEVRIIAVASDQNRSACYWASFTIHSNDFEHSQEGLLSAVRNAPKDSVTSCDSDYSRKEQSEFVN